MKRSLAPITTERTSFALLLQLIVVSSFQLTQMDCSFYTLCGMDTFYNHCIIKLSTVRIHFEAFVLSAAKHIPRRPVRISQRFESMKFKEICFAWLPKVIHYALDDFNFQF